MENFNKPQEPGQSTASGEKEVMQGADQEEVRFKTAELNKEHQTPSENFEDAEYKLLLKKVEDFLYESGRNMTLHEFEVAEDKLGQQLGEIELRKEDMEKGLDSEKHFVRTLFRLAQLANNNLPFFSETDIGQRATALGSEMIRKRLGRLEEEVKRGAELDGDDWKLQADRTDASLQAIIDLSEADYKFGYYDEYKEDTKGLDNLADVIEKVVREKIESDPEEWQSKITNFSQALYPLFKHGNRDNQFRAARLTSEVFIKQGRLWGRSSADPAVFEIVKSLRPQYDGENLNLDRKEEFFLHTALQAYGLAPDDCYDAWTRSIKRKEHKFPDIAYRNLTAMRAVEHLNVEEGAARFLNREFGIYDFGRYPAELLAEQYVERNNADLPYGLIIAPRDDHNGAFYQDRNLYEDLLRRVKFLGEPDERWIMRVVEVGNKRELARFALNLPEKYGQAKFGIVGGHGVPESIALGDGWKGMYNFSIIDLLGQGVQKGGDMLFENGSTIILFSCQTGVESGLAQKSSETFGFEFIGPEESTSPRHNNVEKHEGKLQFEVEYHKGASRAYKGGKLVKN